MNQSFTIKGIFLFFLLIVIWTTTLSHSGGNASTAPCSNCHTSDTAPGGSITVAGIPTSYIAGQTYNLTLCINDNVQPIAGFRLSANGGIFLNPGPGAQVDMTNMKLLHNAPLDITAGNACWTGDWMAPSSGNITFQYYGNAANGNGSNGAGDHGGYAGFVANVSLPVNFASFDLKNENGNILINWSTASETNNDFFDVEWSSDGSIFKRIAQIQGAGSASNLNRYRVIHNHPAKGDNFYRIVQTDFDGTQSMSSTKSIKIEHDQMRVINTIVSSMLYLENVNSFDQSNILIYDYMGNLMLQSKVQSEIDLSTLNQGQYIVIILNGLDQSTYKIIKL